MTMVDEKDEARRQFEATLAELQTLRDELRVRIHLAGMDLKDKWNELESRLLELERPEAAQRLREAATDLRDAFRALRGKVP